LLLPVGAAKALALKAREIATAIRVRFIVIPLKVTSSNDSATSVESGTLSAKWMPAPRRPTQSVENAGESPRLAGSNLAASNGSMAWRRLSVAGV
ncbi:MAG: hypothetical protein ACJ8LG_13650, partial [Massilia sp.]